MLHTGASKTHHLCALKLRTQSLLEGPGQVCLGFSGHLDGKESSCHTGDEGSIPESVRSPEKGMATHSSILAWKIPWT